MGGYDPAVQLAEDIIANPVLLDPTPERESLVYPRSNVSSDNQCNGDRLKRNGSSQAPFLYGDVSAADDFIMVAEKCCWIWGVDSRMMSPQWCDAIPSTTFCMSQSSTSWARQSLFSRKIDLWNHQSPGRSFYRNWWLRLGVVS